MRYLTHVVSDAVCLSIESTPLNEDGIASRCKHVMLSLVRLLLADDLASNSISASGPSRLIRKCLCATAKQRSFQLVSKGSLRKHTVMCRVESHMDYPISSQRLFLSETAARLWSMETMDVLHLHPSGAMLQYAGMYCIYGRDRQHCKLWTTCAFPELWLVAVSTVLHYCCISSLQRLTVRCHHYELHPDHVLESIVTLPSTALAIR